MQIHARIVHLWHLFHIRPHNHPRCPRCLGDVFTASLRAGLRR